MSFLLSNKYVLIGALVVVGLGIAWLLVWNMRAAAERAGRFAEQLEQKIKEAEILEAQREIDHLDPVADRDIILNRL